jgi:hypothetical protein
MANIYKTFRLQFDSLGIMSKLPPKKRRKLDSQDLNENDQDNDPSIFHPFKLVLSPQEARPLETSIPS